jgi:hypothetical protein
MDMSVAEHWRRLQRSLQDHKDDRELYGKPCSPATVPFWLVHDTLRWGSLGKYISRSRRVPGWTRGAEAVALAEVSLSLPDDAVILENGCFLGCSTVLLAGARKLRGSGIVHSVDPFDASGEPFSAPIYRAIRGTLAMSLRQCFDSHIQQAGLSEWVRAHEGYGHDIAAGWQTPIDMLFLDGDQSYEGVRTTYEHWARFLKAGAIVAVHNSAPGIYQDGHDGSLRLVEEVIRPPRFDCPRCIGMTTFARRL